MAKRQQQQPSPPGNDGMWYLGMLGDGTGNGQADTVARAAARTGSTARTTNDLVTEMWEVDGHADPLQDWVPAELDRTMRVRRSFRWTVVLLALLLGVVAAIAIVWVPRVAERRIDDRIDATRIAIASLRSELPAVQAALATATEPGVTSDDLSAAVPALTRVIAAADGLATEGVTPLPDDPPLVDSADLDTLVDLQDRFGFMGAEGAGIARRLSIVVDYRLGLTTFLDLPELVSDADAGEIGSLSEQLATGLANAVQIAGSLPQDAALASHRTELRSMLARFADWQVEYLDALRRGDPETATGLISEMEDLRDDLDDTLVLALADIRADVDNTILELAQQLDTTLQRLPG